MNLKISKISKSEYQVIEADKKIGKIGIYRNLFHDAYIYLKFNLQYYPSIFPFFEIERIENKPLQVMTESSKVDLTSFLLRNGFVCKRKCYQAQVSKNDLKENFQFHHKINEFNSHSKIYKELCLALYNYYKQVHQNVSPLTATFQEFTSDVPTNTGYFDLNKKGKIQNIIFTEKNEIAYAVSKDIASFSIFKGAVLNQLFNQYEQVFFEADNVDPVAMNLLNTFNLDLSTSYDTYIYK